MGDLLQYFQLDLFFILLVVLFIIGIFNLIVGVANDAVNFLNSAVGSRAAGIKTILFVSCLGLLLGVIFSSGMMEVARKGIFNPGQFTLNDLFIILLAAMLTNLILLDIFNTFGLPTSTTVSLVFELLGSAIAVALVKINKSGGDLAQLGIYINSGRALTIITGILLSIALAFVVAVVLQFFTRILFTFQYENKMKTWAPILCSLALTAFSFFGIIQGVKTTTLFPLEWMEYLKNNLSVILSFTCLFWYIILMLLTFFTKVNILKFAVLVGTGALAMAFAANDLVNFLGAPFAGLAGYYNMQELKLNPYTDSMESLAKPVAINYYFLLISGLVMVLTLIFSKKAKTVTQTEVNLGRQEEGSERFGTSFMARTMVRMILNFFETFGKIMPDFLKRILDKRFELPKNSVDPNEKEKASFDLIRAFMNLMISSALISVGTSLKLPLSTTYVTFIVAMGSSLSDRAWGRESAVYRITGVLTVIGGWFLTALVALLISMLFAFLMYFFQIPGLIFLCALTIFTIVRSNKIHKTRDKQFQELEKIKLTKAKNSDEAFAIISQRAKEYLELTSGIFKKAFDGITKDSRKKLKKLKDELVILRIKGDVITTDIIHLYQLQGQESGADTVSDHGSSIGSLNEINRHLTELVEGCYSHIDNNHKGLSENQVKELKEIETLTSEVFHFTLESLQHQSPYTSDKGNKLLDKITLVIKKVNKQQIKRMKTGNFKLKRSLLYLAILTHTENISFYCLELVKNLKSEQKG